MPKILSKLFSPFHELGLRFKIGLVFVLPILILVAFFSYSYYSIENKFLLGEVQSYAEQLGKVISSSLSHSMQMNDPTMIANALLDISEDGDIEQISIIGASGEVWQSSKPTEVGNKLDETAAGCAECHQVSGEAPTVINSPGNEGQVRVGIPIENEIACQECHPASQDMLGMFLIDVSIENTQAEIKNNLQRNLIWSLVIVTVGMVIGFIFVDRFIFQRVEQVHDALNSFEQGDRLVRIENAEGSGDEITRLAQSYNLMADSLLRDQIEQEKISRTRQKAIIEERERIARELHDGIAQFIVYVNAKIIAARLYLKSQKIEESDRQLQEVEHAVQDQSNDIRASIIGLRMASELGAGFANDLRELVEQCNRLTDIPIVLEIAPCVEDTPLDAERELHLIRIIQEAISNIRKHASAGLAKISVDCVADEMIVLIHDDGVGFNPWLLPGQNQTNFGLQTMHERAEMIDAALKIESEPGQGTSITVRLKLKET